jgi:hypothetical protein
MKPFFWNKLNNAPTAMATVWNDLPSHIQLDLSDLESTFIIDDAPSTPSQLLSPKKQTVTTLLDITRANNVGMSLLPCFYASA